MQAIALLKADHDEVKALLAELMATTHRAIKRRTELVEKIAHALQAHVAIEEEIFYPAFREAGDKAEEKMYFEALEEHRAVEALVLPDLQKTDPSSEKFAGRAKVLKELLEHHIGEEESDMFKQAKKLLSTEQLDALGEQMQDRKHQVLAALKKAA
ncbi:hemerythrin domain-containing protein [Dyella sp. 2RAB6]|uniref:hemerythrin domain-containing protein n=1 Tax=Dyella sp. 2RAB6 TaxID=3232992 RepID=UPI003F9014DE